MSSDLPYFGRRAPRINSRESVSIQIVLPSSKGIATSRVIKGITADISIEGIRVVLDEPIEPERIYDLCIELDFNPQYLLLVGETRWCRFNEQTGYYEVGMIIHNSEGTDYNAWADLFSDA